MSATDVLHAPSLADSRLLRPLDPAPGGLERLVGQVRARYLPVLGSSFAAAFLLTLLAFPFEDAIDDDLTIIVYVILVAGAWTVLGSLLLVGSAFWSDARRKRRLGREVEPRRRALQDWYVRGDLTEAEYRPALDAIDRYAEAKFPGAGRLIAGLAAMRVAGVLLAIGLVFLLGFIEESSYMSDEEFFILGTLFVVPTILGTVLLVLGIRLRLQDRAFHDRAREALRAMEEEILKAAHARHRGDAPAPRVGPTFRPYA